METIEQTTKTIDVTPMLKLQNRLKLLHWRARRHGEHVALGDAYEAMDKKIDEFVECFMGSHQSVEWDCFDIVGIADNFGEEPDTYALVRQAFNEFNRCVKPVADDNAALASIRDDMQAIAARLCYLLKMD